jgi:HEAT repeat protein
MGSLQAPDVRRALTDPAGEVRRRACELAGRLGTAGLEDQLVATLSDLSPSVVEAACSALGELGAGGPRPGAVEALGRVATGHRDPLCREAAVAALGAFGDPLGLAAVLAALGDKAAVRRRAVIALTGFEEAFDGGLVQAALRTALRDPDWQVRQGAEDVLGQREGPGAGGPA